MFKIYNLFNEPITQLRSYVKVHVQNINKNNLEKNFKTWPSEQILQTAKRVDISCTTNQSKSKFNEDTTLAGNNSILLFNNIDDIETLYIYSNSSTLEM